MATNIQVCEICQEVEDAAKKFKFRKEKNIAAVVLKINKNDLKVEVDKETNEELQDLEEVDELQNILPASQPRYVLLSYVHKTSDGRETYPYCFIFVSPQGCHPDLTMMYTGSKRAVVQAVQATKVFEVRSLEELTDDFIKGKLA